MEKIRSFIEKNNIFVIFVFFLLSMQTYVFRNLTYNSSAGIIYRAIVLFLIFVYAAFIIYFFRVKPSLVFILISSIYVFSSVIGLFINPLIYNLSISKIKYISSLATIVSNVVSIYIFFVSTKINNHSRDNIFFLTIIIFTFTLCLFTFIFQYNQIYKSLTDKYGWNYDVTSIFYIKTIYGFCLTIGSLYTAYYAFKYDKKIALLAIIFFLLNAVISRNKTSILIISILLLLSVVVLLKSMYKTSKKRFFIFVSIIIFVIALATILISFVEAFSFARNFIKDSIIKDGVTVLSARFDKWGKFFKATKNPFNIIFGYGERISPVILGANNTSDNIYLYSLASGGLIKLCIYLFLIVYLFKKLLKTKNNFWPITCLCLIALSGLFEENYIYGFNLFALLCAPLIFNFFED